MKFGFLKMMIVTAGLILFFASCEKEKVTPELPYEDVFGNWEWYSTELAASGEIILADEVDYTQSLEITTDGKYLWTEGDSTVFESTFEVLQDTTVTEMDLFIFQFDDNSRDDQTFYLKDKDTLFLNEDCESCDTHVFIRK